MKKLLTLISLGVLAVSTSFAQSQRMVLLEHFTQASCGPCATYNPRIKDLINANEDKIVAIKYQTSWPGVDPMNQQNPTQVAARVSYYGVTGVPNSVLDGNYYNGHPQNWDLNKVNTRRAVESPFDLTLSTKLNDAGDSILGTLHIVCTKDVTSANLKAQIVIVERKIEFTKAPGSNGEKEFEHVMKRMLPSENGTDIIGSWTVGMDTTINVSWKLENIYSLPQLGAVAFIQTNVTKEVMQAVYNKTKLPFEIQVNGTGSVASSSISAIPAQTTTATFTTTDTVATDYDFAIAGTLPTGWNASFTIDGVTYTDKATISMINTTPKNVLITINAVAGDINKKGKVTLSMNNHTRLQGYKVTSLFTAFSPVTTMYVATDATSNSKMTAALKGLGKEYLVATGEEFDGFNGNTITPTTIKYVWINSGAALSGTMISDNFIGNVEKYIDNGGKLLLTSPMAGYDAYYSSKTETFQNFWTDYLKQESFTFSNAASELEKQGKTLNPVQNELVMGKYWEEPGTQNASSTAYYGTNLTAGEGQTMILNYDDDADQGAALRMQNDVTGTKVVFGSFRFDQIKETAFRNNLMKRIYMFFDGEDLAAGVSTIANNNNITITPNPAVDNAKITFATALTAASEVNVYNTIGQLVYTNNLSTGTKSVNVNTSNLSEGFYTVKIQSNGNVVSTSKLNIVK